MSISCHLDVNPMSPLYRYCNQIFNEHNQRVKNFAIIAIKAVQDILVKDLSGQRQCSDSCHNKEQVI